MKDRLNSEAGNKDSSKNPPKLNKNRIPVEKLLFEFFSIVVGVMLALGLNQWRENRQYQKKADLALTKIHGEIDSNLKLIEYIHENNLKTMKEIELMMEKDSIIDNDFIPGLQISNNAWKAMQSTDVSDFIDYDIISQLSELYSIQDVYMKTGYLLLESMLNTKSVSIGMNSEIDNKKLLIEMYDYFNTVIQVEEILKNLLEKNDLLLSKYSGKDEEALP